MRMLLGSVLIVGFVAAGCGRKPVASGTGAKKVAQSYFDALIRHDWQNAYALLDSTSQTQCNGEQFSSVAQNYRVGLGFEPTAVHIRACDEQGAEATAHVILSGKTGDKERRYKDAIRLRRGDDGWGVVLPWDFGLGR